MKFGEKLKRLMKGMTRAQLARDAKVTPSIINNYINRGSEPMAFTAARLAKALAVPLEWLLDDAAEWPPPDPVAKLSPRQLDDQVLMFEVTDRYCRGLLRLMEALDTAEKINWDKLPDRFSLGELLGILASIRHAAELMMRFNPRHLMRVHHATMPGRDRPLEDFDEKKLAERAMRLMHDPRVPAALQMLLKSVPQDEWQGIVHELLWTDAWPPEDALQSDPGHGR